MNIKWKPLVILLAIPLAVGGLSALLTMNSMQLFDSLEKPPLSPPGWLFPVVWTILFILMGVASYLVYTSGKKGTRAALGVYAVQLAFNFLWTIIFFDLQNYLFAFIWLILLWILIWITIALFYRVSKPAAALLVPYLLWVTFAAYLNLGIWLLN